MSERGFTLVEVLIALLLTGLVAVLAYGALSSTITASEMTSQESHRLQALERAFRLLQRDIAQAVKRPVSDNYGEREPVFSGGQETGAVLSLTRTGWPDARQQGRSDIQRVEYRWQDKRLWRDYWFNADRGPSDTPVSVLLLDNITGLKLRFLDAKGGTIERSSAQWRDVWLARDGADQLPAAVEIVLELEVWGEVRRLFVLPANA